MFVFLLHLYYNFCVYPNREGTLKKNIYFGFLRILKSFSKAFHSLEDRLLGQISYFRSIKEFHFLIVKNGRTIRILLLKPFTSKA